MITRLPARDTPAVGRTGSARLARLSSFASRRAVIVLVGWTVMVSSLSMVGGWVGTTTMTPQELEVGGSATARAMLASAGFPDRASEHLLVSSRSRTVADAAFSGALTAIVHAIRKLPVVTAISSPLDPRSETLVAEHGHAARIDFQLRGPTAHPQRLVTPVLAAVADVSRRYPEVRIGEFGDASTSYELQRTLGQDFHRAEGLSIPLTAVVLVIAFRAVFAAIVPVGLAFSCVTAALGVIALLSHASPVMPGVSSIVLLIGLAVGVDYSLFFLTRVRWERARGEPRRAAAVHAAATAGRAVVASGAAVILAVATLFAAGEGVFSSFALAVTAVVAIAVVAAVIVLPALVVVLGRLLEWRERRTDHHLWEAVLARVLRRPLVSLAASMAMLLVLAWPAQSLRTQMPGLSELPSTLPVVATYDALQRAFPGQMEPAEVVLAAPRVTDPAVRSAIDRFRSQAVASRAALPPIGTAVNRAGTVAKITVPLPGTGTDTRSDNALRMLRDRVIPETLGRVVGGRVAVGGVTATREDFAAMVAAKAPLVLALVLLGGFIVLLVTFRSLVVPAKAIVLNLLSVAAAVGVLVSIFQDGYGASLLGTHHGTAIISWVPLFLFVVLFGLSMDYHVFILSRIRELVDQGLPTPQAVERGITDTAGVVTSAALVMISVFCVFAALRTLQMKQLGVGLAAAITIDATVVRVVLLPSTMKLLGRWNWYLPRLTHASVGGPNQR